MASSNGPSVFSVAWIAIAVWVTLGLAQGPPFYCNSIVNNCSNHAVAVGGGYFDQFDIPTCNCTCLNNWTEVDCSVCPVNFNISNDCSGCAFGYVNPPTCSSDRCTDDADCSGKSSAVSGYRTTGCNCTCLNNYVGQNCSICPPNFDQSPDVLCRSGVCAPGYDGRYCSPLCTQANCSNRAALVTGNYRDGCSCTCIVGWDGSNCSYCAVGYTGAQCNICSDGYSGYPTCVPCSNALNCTKRSQPNPTYYANNHSCVCHCINSYTGPNCATCPPQYNLRLDCGACAEGYQGTYPNCYRNCNYLDCNDHATHVSGDTNTGCVCTCYKSWLPPDCAICPPQFDAQTNCSKCAANRVPLYPSCPATTLPPTTTLAPTTTTTTAAPTTEAPTTTGPDGSTPPPPTTLPPNTTEAPTTTGPGGSTPPPPTTTEFSTTTTFAPTTTGPGGSTPPPPTTDNSTSTTTAPMSTTTSTPTNASNTTMAPTTTTAPTTPPPKPTPTPEQTPTKSHNPTRSFTGNISQTDSHSLNHSQSLSRSQSLSISECPTAAFECLLHNHTLNFPPKNCKCTCNNSWSTALCSYCDPRYDQFLGDCGNCSVHHYFYPTCDYGLFIHGNFTPNFTRVDVVMPLLRAGVMVALAHDLTSFIRNLTCNNATNVTAYILSYDDASNWFRYDIDVLSAKQQTVEDAVTCITNALRVWNVVPNNETTLIIDRVFPGGSVTFRLQNTTFNTTNVSPCDGWCQNGAAPPEPTEESSFPIWIVILVIALIIAIITAVLLYRRHKAVLEVKMNRNKLVERMLDATELGRVDAEMSAQDMLPGGKVASDTARTGSSVRRRAHAPITIPHHDI